MRYTTRGLVVAATAMLALSACGGGGANVETAPTTGNPTSAVADGQDASPSEANSPAEDGVDGADDGDAPNGDGDGGGGNGEEAGRNLPRLVELNAHAGNTYSGVELRFAPGEGRPVADIEESNDATVTRPGSGQPVQLAGDQALRVTISPAVADDVEPLRPQGPAIAEVRVLGFFEGQVALGIGVYGEGNLSPEVSREENTLSIAIRNATDVGGEPQACGDVGFEPNTDHGAFDITAKGVNCQLARDVAAAAEGQVGDSYETSSGFTCLPKRDESGPTTSIHYTCSRGAATITFTAS